MRHNWVPAIFLAALSGCATQPSPEPLVQAAGTSILAQSNPPNGSSVAGPVNQLTLHFSRPARLIEVTIDGPDGLSPMMITAAGDTTDYAIPLPGFGSGIYRVNWRATAAGSPYSGSISFTVRG